MSPRKDEDDGGPTDEESSTSSSEIIQQTHRNIEQPAENDESSFEANVHNPATNDGQYDNPLDRNGLLGEVPAAKEHELADSEEFPTHHVLLGQRETPVSSGYVSIGGHSKSSTIKTFRHEDDMPDDEDSLSRPKSRIATKAATTTRKQVLVHYHPQLGDEGFESTLVPDSMVEPATPSSRGRPMDGSPYYTGGAAGMNSRMMEDVRDGRTYNYNSSPPTSPMNDEQNNAATRQIRRRVFRAALERGIHDERRKKMLDADADIGGPSVVRGGGGATSSSYYNWHPGGVLTRSRDDADDEDIPMSPRTPKSYEGTAAIGNFSPTAATPKQTISPPAPPVAPPSYRTIIEKLIRDNEPQKLPQLDKVLAKYRGREEELIMKLDLRYKRMKQKAGAAILQDLEKSEKVGKEQVISPARSGEESRNSQKSKDVYFVKVSEAPLPGAIKLPSDIIDSNKTAPQSNVRKALAIEDEGDIPAIPKRNAAPAAVAAAVAAEGKRVSELTTVEKEEIKSTPNLQEPDEISEVTMETKETRKKKMNERGEDTYSWLQRPPNSITVDGGGAPNIEDPLSPERKSKINKLLPEFDQEKEEDKAKADDAKLVPIALDDVEARILARRKIMEEEAKKKTVVSSVDAKKDNDGKSNADERASVIEDAESFVGKPKSKTPASTQEDEVQLSLIDQQERVLTESKAVREEPKQMKTAQAALQVGGDDDVNEEEEIDQLLKESRLQAEKAIALRKAQRELEKEKKARMEAEAARIALEEELARLKAEAAGNTKPIAPRQANVADSDSDENAVEDDAHTSDEPLKYDLNKTFSSVSVDNSEQENAIMQDGDIDETQSVKDTDGGLSDGVDIAGDSAELIESSRNEEEADQVLFEDEDFADEIIASTEPGGIVEDTLVETEELSQRDDGDIVSQPPDEVAAKKMNEEVDQSVAQGATKRSEHDDSSPTMVHASPAQDRISERRSDADEDANINHVATMTFEGNRAKGQLSFITGSKILAHSNQRGPWWLGRCGKQTGWFPANAVVPESEFLKNIAVALPAEMDEASDRLGKLSNEELAATYDLIRNPSDPIDDDDDNDDDDDDGSPARSRWLTDSSSNNAAQSPRSGSPPPSRSDPSKMEGLNQQLYEPNKSDAVEYEYTPQLGFEGMNRLGKSVEEHSQDKPKKTYIGPPQVITETVNTETESPNIIQSNSGSKSKKKKKPQEWRAAEDPGTGLTYYYHLKTREVSYTLFWFYLEKNVITCSHLVITLSSRLQTTWDKPADFDDAPAAGKDDSKAKGLSGAKILRLFSKKKKKPKSPSDNEIVTPSSTFSFDEKKPAAKASAKLTTESLVATRNVVGNETGIVFPNHDDDDDDDSSSSDSDESSLFSRENIYNQKAKLKNAVRKFSGKFSQNESPKNVYEQLGDGEVGNMQIDVTNGGTKLNHPETSEPKKANPIKWRSAIDAATGRTYYYVKGGKETFWEKPKDM